MQFLQFRSLAAVCGFDSKVQLCPSLPALLVTASSQKNAAAPIMPGAFQHDAVGSKADAL